MSVIKKYQSGGSTSAPKLSVEKYLANELDKNRFTKEGRGYAEEAFDNFGKLAQKENLNEVFNFDSVVCFFWMPGSVSLSLSGSQTLGR